MKKRIFSTMFALVLLLTLGLVTAAPVSAATFNVPTPYATIQAAIDAAGSGDTVSVAAGTYIEDLVIPDSKTNLELVGAEGAVIKGVANVPMASWPLAVPNIDIRADGVKIHGFTIQGPDWVENYYASGIVLDGVGIEIYDNDFVPTPAENFDELGPAITTYSLTAGLPEDPDCSGLNIHDNTFVGSGAAGCEFIYVNPHKGTGSIVIDSNQFSGSVLIGATVESGKTSFTNNVVTNTGGAGLYGVRFMDSQYGNNGSYVDIVISGNAISGCERAIRVGNGSVPDSSVFVATISSNTLTGNDLGVWGRNGNQLVVEDNNIAGNTAGVLNANGDATVTPIDASNNWWGDASGPSGEGPGTGDSVSTNVDYDPWYSSAVVSTDSSSTELSATYAATPPPVIGISVLPTEVGFGAVVPGVASDPETVTVTNEGTVAALLTAEITVESVAGVYTNGLKIAGSSVSAWSAGLASPGTVTPQLILTVPGGTAPGTYTATLVFWAEASP